MKENLMRMIYCEMLGHDASFGFIHAVNYTQKGKLKDKRLGKEIFFFASLLLFLVKLAKIQPEKVSHDSVFAENEQNSSKDCLLLFHNGHSITIYSLGTKRYLNTIQANLERTATILNQIW